MTRPTLTALAILILLAACGADGAPKPPAKGTEPGISITGRVKVGVAGSA